MTDTLPAETAGSDLVLSLRRIIRATPERVYAAWLDPAVMKRFMTGASDMTVKEARSDARVDGTFFVLMSGKSDVPHRGTYLELTPFSRIRFTWESPFSPADSEVDLKLAAVDGGTELVLTQRRFLSEGSRNGHREGWTSILERLDSVLAG